MHKLMINVAVVTLAAASFAGASFAVEQPKIQATATTTLRAAGPLSNNIEQAVRPKLMGLNAVAPESRSTTAESQLGESNTFGMLLAGLAIMGLVVRRRMN
jgi:hypothetical protein